MQFEIEIYKEKDKNMCFICTSDGTTGAVYPAENIAQIARAVSLYLEDYYPDCVPEKE